MKVAITTTEADAKAIQAADDAAAHLPWPSVYLDGSPCPTAWTLHRYDVQTKPDGKAFAFPVEDTAASKAPGDALSKATIVDKLPADWTAAEAAPKEEPIEGKGEGAVAVK